MNEHPIPSAEKNLKKDTLSERLARHPHLHERIEAILSIAEANGEGFEKADAVEEALLDAVRALGRDALSEWAAHGIKKAVGEAKEQTPKASLHRKKN